MPKSLRYVLVIAIGVVITLACRENTGPPSLVRDLDIVVPHLGRAVVETRVTTVARERERSPAPSLVLTPEDGEGSGELPPEWQAPPTITSYSTAAEIEENVAWGQAVMEYIASHARQTVRLDLRLNNAHLTSVPGTNEESAFLPRRHTLWTTAKVNVSKTCGHTAEAFGEHSAWHQPPIPLPGLPSSWGRETRSSRGPAKSQPPCAPEETDPEPDTGGGGGGGGGDDGEVKWYTCYWYYEYDMNTGEVTYVQFLGCEEAE